MGVDFDGEIRHSFSESRVDPMININSLSVRKPYSNSCVMSPKNVNSMLVDAEHNIVNSSRNAYATLQSPNRTKTPVHSNYFQSIKKAHNSSRVRSAKFDSQNTDKRSYLDHLRAKYLPETSNSLNYSSHILQNCPQNNSTFDEKRLSISPQKLVEKEANPIEKGNNGANMMLDLSKLLIRAPGSGADDQESLDPYKILLDFQNSKEIQSSGSSNNTNQQRESRTPIKSKAYLKDTMQLSPPKKTNIAGRKINNAPKNILHENSAYAKSQNYCYEEKSYSSSIEWNENPQKLSGLNTAHTNKLWNHAL